jgi:hypothetical protein
MRTALLFIILASAVGGGAWRADAARSARQCPAVKVSCPDMVTGDSIEFKAVVDTAVPELKLTYDWQLSAGTVAGGQGTPVLKADATGLAGQTVTATVEVGGLPDGCERKSSCTTAVPGPLIGCGFDEYGDIRFDDEKARLDSFAIELQSDPTAEGYLTCYGGRRGYLGEAVRRCERAKGYLSGVRGIAPERLVNVDGGFREELTVKLVIVPAGATPPVPTPTVDPREVVIIHRGARRR